jgi:hypothetical protein
MSWTACYDDSCLIYLSEKDGSGYFPRGGKDSYEKDEDQVQFNMAFGEPEDYGPEEIEILSEDWHDRPTETIVLEVEPEPDDWFEIGETAPEEFEELPRFEENERSVPEYQPYMDATHQKWARENIMFRERANAVLGRCREIKEDLKERREKSRSLRRQFDSIIEHVDILSEFLEKLRNKTVGYECVIYRGGLPIAVNAVT